MIRSEMRPRLLLKAAGLTALSATMLPGSAEAALAPEYNRVNDLTIIINSYDVQRALHDHGLIEKVEALDDGSFRVSAKRCFVIVRLIERSAPSPGPPRPGARTTPTAQVGSPVCP